MMPTESQMLHLDDLLQSLSNESPSGQDPRLDLTPRSLYFRLRDARSEARAEERLADNDPSAPDGAGRHWKTVHDLAVETLATSAKDIEVAAWLTESMVRSHGLPGLTAAAHLLHGLIEQFWDDGLYPVAEEDDPEGRVVAIAGLNGQESNGTLMQPLRKIVLFDSATSEPIRFWQFEEAEEVAALNDANRRKQRMAGGVLALADLEAEARGAGRIMLRRVGQDVTQAVAAWRALDTMLLNKAGSAAPSTRRILDLLEKLRRLVERYAGPIETAATNEADEVPDGPMEADGGPGRATATVARVLAEATYDRAALLQEITRIASLFRTNEPNSPLSYTLDDAVRRARLGWPELLREMMPELAPRTALLSSLGIRPVAD